MTGLLQGFRDLVGDPAGPSRCHLSFLLPFHPSPSTLSCHCALWAVSLLCLSEGPYDLDRNKCGGGRETISHRARFHWWGHAFQWVLLGSSALVWSCTRSLAASQHRHCRRSMGNSDIAARDVKQRGCGGSHRLCPQGPWPGSPEEQEDEASLSCSLVQ